MTIRPSSGNLLAISASGPSYSVYLGSLFIKFNLNNLFSLLVFAVEVTDAAVTGPYKLENYQYGKKFCGNSQIFYLI